MKRVIKAATAGSDITVRDRSWQKFLDKVEEATGLSVDAAYRRAYDPWIVLYDAAGRQYDAEITKYHNGDYEFCSRNLSESAAGQNYSEVPISECDKISAAYRDDSIDMYASDSDWCELASKQVEDADGFLTDYTLYQYTGDPEDVGGYIYICMFGDRDLYEPDEDQADWSGETEEEAWEWFDNYESYEM